MSSDVYLTIAIYAQSQMKKDLTKIRKNAKGYVTFLHKIRTKALAF